MRRLLVVPLFLFASCAYRTSVWMTPWDAASIASVEANRASISELNPVWFRITPQGTIEMNWNADKPFDPQGRRLVPTIQNANQGEFDSGLAKVLADPELRRRHAEELVQLVLDKHYDGIDIDYERLPSTSRGDLNVFLALLSGRLHQHRKELSVTLHPKTNDRADWAGPGGQDWRFIGKVADSVKVMAYDYHYSSSEPGPLAPLAWLDEIARYADATIGHHKVLIALPWYGYDWSGGHGSTVGYSDATKLAADHNVVVQRDENGEPFFHYDDHVVFFQDATSYGRKLDVLTRHHRSIAGFAHWRAGKEDPASWREVGDLRKWRLWR
jgi:spore germination protein